MCIALRYYATGTFQRQIGDSGGASQASLHRIVHHVSEVAVVFRWNVYSFAEFPNCVRAINGTQIPLKCPWLNGEQYKNYNKYYSIAAQIIVNHWGAITHLSCRWPTSTTDLCTLKESFIQNVLDQNILGKYYLLGNSGYSCQFNLLIPYNKRLQGELTEEEKLYNKCLSRTRVKVECVISQMKNKFACLQQTLHYQPPVVSNIIKACTFLWNFRLLMGDNKGYDPDQCIVAGHNELNCSWEGKSTGGFACREILKNYLWAHKHGNKDKSEGFLKKNLFLNDQHVK